MAFHNVLSVYLIFVFKFNEQKSQNIVAVNYIADGTYINTV